MADIDKQLIGQIISSIPYDQAFGAPLSAAIDAQSKASDSCLRALLAVAFTTDKDGNKQTQYAEFEFEDSRSDGSKETRRLKIPMLLLVNLPNISIESGVITFDLEISQSAEVKEDISAGGETEAKIGWGPFSLSLKAKASYDKSSTRKTDTRAKQHVELHIKQVGPPEAVNVMMEIMRDAALGAGAGRSPDALPDKSAGTVTPSTIPAPPNKTGEPS